MQLRRPNVISKTFFILCVLSMERWRMNGKKWYASLGQLSVSNWWKILLIQQGFFYMYSRLSGMTLSLLLLFLFSVHASHYNFHKCAHFGFRLYSVCVSVYHDVKKKFFRPRRFFIKTKFVAFVLYSIAMKNILLNDNQLIKYFLEKPENYKINSKK